MHVAYFWRTLQKYQSTSQIKLAPPNIMHRFITPLILISATILIPLQAAPPHPLPQCPGATENLILKAPITRWDDAIPLGNGLTGGLLWGGDCQGSCPYLSSFFV